MATEPSFASYVLEQIRSSGPVRVHKMFGEYAVYLDEKVVALLADNSFFLKPTEAGHALLGSPTLGPPYPGAKPFYVLDEFLDDADYLTKLVEVTAAALPAPKPKKAKTAKAKTVAKAPATRKKVTPKAAKKTVANKSAAKKKRSK